MTVKTKPKAQAKVRAQAKAKVKTKARRRPARKEPSRIALATAYTRGYARALSKEFPKAYPEVPKQDEFLSTRCGELGARYAGGPQVIREKGLVTYWDTLSRESWETGSRSVNCKVSAQLPDGSGLAPVTGTVKGKVEVGEKPAPESPEKIQPGVPAGRTR